MGNQFGNRLLSIGPRDSQATPKESSIAQSLNRANGMTNTARKITLSTAN